MIYENSQNSAVLLLVSFFMNLKFLILAFIIHGKQNHLNKISDIL